MDYLAVLALVVVVGGGVYTLESDEAELHEVLLGGAIALIIANFLITGVLAIAKPDHGDLFLPMVGVFLGSYDINPWVLGIATGAAAFIGAWAGDNTKKARA